MRRLTVQVYDRAGSLLGSLAVVGNSLTIKDDDVLKVGNILKEHAEKLMERI